jgi:hypothetical protein
VRPATPLICQFIDEHKGTYGVVPICRALGVHGVQIAPRTYWAHRASAPSKRALWDTTITEILAGVYEPDAEGKRPPESLYGSLKMWAHLQRQGIPVARRTVERIMRANGWRGVTRARRAPRTTEPDPAAARAPDLVRRRWQVAAPNLLVVADFTYVPLYGSGFGYTAFVVDAYAGVIPGWECSLSMIPIASAMTVGQQFGFATPFTASIGWERRYGEQEVSQFRGAELSPRSGVSAARRWSGVRCGAMTAPARRLRRGASKKKSSRSAISWLTSAHVRRAWTRWPAWPRC